MRIRFSVWLIGIATGLSALPDFAHAQFGPVIVVPGTPKAKILMGGQDVSGAIIEGDWGLARPGQVTPTIIQKKSPEFYGPEKGRYFPSTGRAPEYGRLEIEPPEDRPLPKPAESYFRFWSSESDTSRPVDISPYYQAPEIPAEVFIDRRHRRDRDEDRRRRQNRLDRSGFLPSYSYPPSVLPRSRNPSTQLDASPNSSSN